MQQLRPLGAKQILKILKAKTSKQTKQNKTTLEDLSRLKTYPKAVLLKTLGEEAKWREEQVDEKKLRKPNFSGLILCGALNSYLVLDVLCLVSIMKVLFCILVLFFFPAGEGKQWKEMKASI